MEHNTKRGRAKMICPECDGTGRVELCNRNGYYEAPCTNCYESLGEVNDDEQEPEHFKPVGNHTGRNGAKERLERLSGWPAVTGAWEEQLAGRRFDEPGMEVRFKKVTFERKTSALAQGSDILSRWNEQGGYIHP